MNERPRASNQSDWIYKI